MSILTEVYHLQELSRYGVEKPYTMRYVPEGKIPVSNVAREKHVIEVNDMRGAENEYQIDKQGFMISGLVTKMEYEDYDSHEKITNTYLPELEGILQEQFPGSTVDFVSYLVTVSSQTFNYSHLRRL